MTPLLSICCTCYNHEKYIADAINGFLIQKTTFPIEILIHDDASTDSSQKIIKEFAEKDDRIKTIFQTENQYSKNIKPFPNFLFPSAKGKYIAICDGDDYWIDPLKLQKQVEFLEQTDEHILCSTNFEELRDLKTITKSNLELKIIKSKHSRLISLNNFLSPNLIKTSTVVFRNHILEGETMLNASKIKGFKDIFLFALLLNLGKGYVIKDTTTIYRIHNSSVWSTITDLKKVELNYITLKAIDNWFNKKNTYIHFLHYKLKRKYIRKKLKNEKEILFEKMKTKKLTTQIFINKIFVIPKLFLYYQFQYIKSVLLKFRNKIST